jgi:hypothetical protein
LADLSVGTGGQASARHRARDGRTKQIVLQESRGDCPFPKDNRSSLGIATLAIFPEYVEFDGEEVLKLVVQGEAGRTIK